MSAWFQLPPLLQWPCLNSTIRTTFEQDDLIVMHVVVDLDKIHAESQENTEARCQFTVKIQIYTAFNGMCPYYACYRNICYMIHPVSD